VRNKLEFSAFHRQLLNSTLKVRGKVEEAVNAKATGGFKFYAT